MLVDETFHEEAFVIFLKRGTTEIENDLLFLSKRIYLVILAVEFLMEIFDTPDIRGNLKWVSDRQKEGESVSERDYWRFEQCWRNLW